MQSAEIDVPYMAHLSVITISESQITRVLTDEDIHCSIAVIKNYGLSFINAFYYWWIGLMVSFKNGGYEDLVFSSSGGEIEEGVFRVRL